jgi:hypothetical protein
MPGPLPAGFGGSGGGAAGAGGRPWKVGAAGLVGEVDEGEDEEDEDEADAVEPPVPELPAGLAPDADAPGLAPEPFDDTRSGSPEHAAHAARNPSKTHGLIGPLVAVLARKVS